MSASQPAPSPLARLVLFMVCLGIAGSILAGAHYIAIDLPQQKALTAPANAVPTCAIVCASAYQKCDGPVCDEQYRTCLHACGY